MNLRGVVRSAVKTFNRKCRPIQFGDVTRTKPISTRFGLDRGTPIDRYYIETYIAANQSAIHGLCIEVGEVRYLSQYSERVSEARILVPPGTNSAYGPHIIVADLTIPDALPVNVFDCFVCTQTLNFIYDVKAAVRGAHRLLKPGGTFLGTVAGISQISRYDMDRWGDYWRFTNLSVKRILGEVFGPNLDVVCYGNSLAAQLFLQGAAIEDLVNKHLLDVRDIDYEVTIGFRATKNS